ncbi:hypothetical protein CMQ_1376 [Grosmannia clavigera kw1407]|uniref:Uncharacterized protein n=1 Tax=Grosmannia clavigera (strain kw1407 / UAMH 11150) TaxID=655863 RepID=F0XFU2_GROCL|nr:uncharacterized protein CMQ_1376 [Grosmannia clavigera kw1407]EFX04448.1 hypothetical protein CMQ_1376 [Grosmannia clavigera kw1407]
MFACHTGIRRQTAKLLIGASLPLSQQQQQLSRLQAMWLADQKVEGGGRGGSECSKSTGSSSGGIALATMPDKIR